MEIKANVNWKFRVDGKEYGPVVEMPAADRDTYEKAMRPLGVGAAVAALLAGLYFLARGVPRPTAPSPLGHR